ncbi:MAG: hypothetical protein ACI8ZM_003851 [Crocinitomix sp.]|jgi:hypothetical protein
MRIFTLADSIYEEHSQNGNVLKTSSVIEKLSSSFFADKNVLYCESD